MRILLAISLLILSACSPNSNPPNIEPTPDLFLEAKSGVISGTLDIGEIATGSKLISITIKNTGTESLVGPGVLDNEHFTFVSGYDCNKSISKSASCTMKLTFNATGKTPGEYVTNLNLDSVFAVLKATIPVPPPPAVAIDLQTELVDFGTVLAGTTSSLKIITVKNISTSSVLMEQLVVPSGFAIAYDACSGKSVSKNATCTIRLTYTAASTTLTSVIQEPLNFMGDTATLKVSVNNPNILPPTEPGGEPVVANPVLAALYNNVIVSEVNYGTLSGSATMQALINIKNNGETTTPNLNFTLDNSNFSIAFNQCENKQLNKNASCQMRIIFSASGKNGPYTSVLSGNGLSINLLANVATTEIVTYRGVYSAWNSCSATQPCDGMGLQNRTLDNCEKVVNGTPSGQMVNLSSCAGMDSNSYVQQTCASPAGPQLVTILGGEQIFSCNSGDIQPHFVSVSCEPGYSIDGQICKTDIICNGDEHVENEMCVSNIRDCSPSDANASSGTQTFEFGAWSSCSITGCTLPYELAMDGQSCENIAYTYNPVFSNYTSCSATTACMGQGEQIRTVDFCEKVRNGIPTGELEPASANCIDQVSSNDLVLSCNSPSGQIPVIITGGEKVVSCMEGSSDQTFVSIDCFESGFTVASDGQSCQSTSTACASNQIYLNGSCQNFTTTSNITYAPVADMFNNVTEPYNLVYPTDSMAFDMYNAQYQFDQVGYAFSNLTTSRMIGENWTEDGPQYQYENGCFANLSGIDDMYGSGVRTVACQSFGGSVVNDMYGSNEMCALPASVNQCQQLINDMTNKVINTAVVGDCFYDYGGYSYCSGWKVDSAYPWLATASGVSSGNQVMKGTSNATHFVKVNGEGFYVSTSYQYFLFKPLRIKVSVVKISNGQKVEFDFSDIKPFANMLIDPKDTLVFNNQIYVVGRVQANVYNGVESTFIMHKIDPSTLTQTKVVQQSFTDGFSSTSYYANRIHYLFMKDNEIQWTNYVWGSSNIPTNTTLIPRYRLPLSGTSALTAGSITYQDAQYLHMGYTNPLPAGSGFIRAEQLLSQARNQVHNNIKAFMQTVKANVTTTNLSNNQQTVQNNIDVQLNDLLSGHNTGHTFLGYQVSVSGELINLPQLWSSSSAQTITRTQDDYGYGSQSFDLTTDLIRSVVKVSDQRVLIVGAKLRIISSGQYFSGQGRLSEARLDDWQYKVYNFATQQVEETFNVTNHGTRVFDENQIDNGDFLNVMNGNEEVSLIGLSGAQANQRYILFTGYGGYGGYSYRVIDMQNHTLKVVSSLGSYEPTSEGLMSNVYLLDDNIYYVKTSIGYSSCTSGMIEYGNGNGCDANLYKLSALNPDQSPTSVPVSELNDSNISGNVYFRINFFKDRLLVKLEGSNGFGGTINTVSDYSLPGLEQNINSSLTEVEQCVTNAYSLFNHPDVLKGPLSYSASSISGLYCIATGTNGSTLFKLNW